MTPRTFANHVPSKMQGMAKNPIRSIEKILGDADALIRRRLGDSIGQRNTS